MAFTFCATSVDCSAAPEFALSEIDGRRVLVVEHNPINMEVFRQQLSIWGCQIEEATSVDSGLAILQAAKEPFDILLLDHKPPTIDGELFATQLRKDPSFESLAVILVTSIPQRGDAKKLQEIGVQGYLTKPVKQKSLFLALSAAASIRGGQVDQRPLITEHALRENPLGRGRVLVAEDNATSQRFVSLLLERLGQSCDLASNGAEALEAVQNADYDLVLMDCLMPVMNGWEATRRIRAWEAEQGRPPLRIVALTGGVTSEEIQACTEAGMDEFLSKPLKSDALKQILREAIPQASVALTHPDLSGGPPESDIRDVRLRDNASRGAPT